MRVLLFSLAPAVMVATSLVGLSCGVDESGLNQKPFLPHDAAATDAPGMAGAAGGASGIAGVGGSTPAGVAGSAGGVSGVAGSGSAGAGDAGTSGAAGTTGIAGQGGAAGTTTGQAGIGGVAGNSAGVAGMGGVGGGSVAGMDGGAAGMGGGAMAGGRGGTGMAGAGGRGGAGSGGRGGSTGNCTPFNCNDGCCDAGVCVRMRTAQKCGSNGMACAACGACQLCTTAGQCRVDSASRWTIVAVSAVLEGGGWDRNMGDLGGSAPDPFCEFENPAGQVSSTTAGVTDTIIDDATAAWNQVITPPGMTVAASTLMANNPTWQIWVGDDDGCDSPQGCLGDIACTYQSSISEAALRAGELTISNRMSCVSLKLQFVCQAPLAGE